MKHEEPDGANLEAAFAAPAGDPSESSACPGAEAAWDALSGASPPRARRSVVDHLASCGPCAEAWRPAAAAGAAGARTGAARRVPKQWIAAAARLIAAVSLWLATRPAPDAEYRQGTRHEIASLVATSALPREDFRLRWSTVEPGTGY